MNLRARVVDFRMPEGFSEGNLDWLLKTVAVSPWKIIRARAEMSG